MTRPNKNRLAFIASLGLMDESLVKVNTLWSKYETGIHDAVRQHGSHYTLERYKECYLFLRNIILELPAQPIPWCKVDSEGYPKPLWPLRSLIKGDRTSRRIALTIARSYELIKLPIDYHPKSIEEEARKGDSYQETTEDFKQWLTKFVQRYPWYLGSLHKLDSYEPKVFTTLAKGPNGPAVSSAHLDAKAVTSDPVLYSSIKRLNNALQQSWITKWMENMARTVDGENQWITGRLGFIPEPAGKTRVFAIADYWSQTSLKVLQISLYNTLRSISTDATANQNKGFQSLIKEAYGKCTYCFDLSAASDRIPAEMQKYRLELLGDKELGDAWLSVMTDRAFLVKATGRKLRWKVGQPLGLLSSFPSFALWHHDIIQYAYYRCRRRRGFPPRFFKDYRLLGDDVVIFNKEVAGEYQYLIEEIFDIRINLKKSVIGDSKNSQIEFAKRLALKGVEMSSIKHNILTKSSLQNMLDLIDIMYERDFIDADTGHYGCYPFLSSKEQTLFNFMVWVRSNCDTPFEIQGIISPCLILRADFEIFLKSKRISNLMEKTTLLDDILGRIRPLSEYYSKRSLPYNVRALGLEQLNIDGLELHPLVWAINQTGLDLSITLSTIWDEQCPDVSPVEYLPIVSPESYFETPRKGSKEFLSKLILSVFNELSDETQLKNNNSIQTPLD
jgi:hypothetical protein